MKTLDRADRNRLGGRALLLSASIPDRPPFTGSPFAIEQAVLAFVRAVLASGGRLVFGGHPTITRLVASVAAEYVRPRLGTEDAPITVCQSRAFEGFVPGETWEMNRLGYAHILWTEAQNGERFVPGAPGPQCPTSLAAMRRTMLTRFDPLLMMVVGGMEGVVDEVRRFHASSPERPIYVVRSAGGAAAEIANSRRDESAPVRVLEEEWRAATDLAPTPTADEPADADAGLLPYSILMQWLIERVARELS